jgi:tRNA (guanine37-N1)-methyltransferase
VLKIDIITIFPGLFDSFLNESLVKKAIGKKLISVKAWDLRAFTTDKHRTVDDRPYGGGPGMIFKIEPLVKALKKIKKKSTRVYLLDPAGEQFDQRTAEKLSELKHLVLIAGRYEGFDDRIRHYIDGAISVGPYVLNGGEVAAMAVIEATFRLLPGALGHADSAKEETHMLEGFVEYPQYTRPEVFEKKRVPDILLSGDHKKISAWRRGQKKSSS